MAVSFSSQNNVPGILFDDNTFQSTATPPSTVLTFSGLADQNNAPASLSSGVQFSATDNNITYPQIGTNAYGTILTLDAKTIGGTQYGATQLFLGYPASGTGNADNYIRSISSTGISNNTNSWTSWAKILTDKNIASYSGNITGGVLNLTNGIEIGSTTTANNPYIDFHSSGFNNDYDARIYSTGGTNNVLGAAKLYFTTSEAIFSSAVTANGLVSTTAGLKVGNSVSIPNANDLLVTGAITAGTSILAGTTISTTNGAIGAGGVNGYMSASTYLCTGSYTCSGSYMYANTYMCANTSITAGQTLTINGTGQARSTNTINNTNGSQVISNGNISILNCNGLSPTYDNTAGGMTLCNGGNSANPAVNISTGNLFGGTSYAGIFKFTNNVGTSNPNKYMRLSPNGSMQYRNSANNLTIFELADNGDLAVTGDITGYSSDERLKKDFHVISDPLVKLFELSGYTFSWNKELCESLNFHPSESVEHGVKAQEVQKIVPDAVSIAPFDKSIDENGNVISLSGENYLTVKYERLVPLLIEAVKELTERVRILEGK